MRNVNKKAREARKVEIMEKCFACYCDNGLNGVGIKAIAKACESLVLSADRKAELKMYRKISEKKWKK